MGMPLPNETENPLYSQILKQKSNLNSFWAFLLSIFVYVSVFYVFNLSPSTDLLCTTKFWFIISNTLILIIAADFSSSKTINDVVTTTAPPLLKTMPKYPTQQQPQVEPPEKIINIVQVTKQNKPKLEKMEPMILEENDDELNKRVEEFIRRCNTQIRLQAVSNRTRQG